MPNASRRDYEIEDLVQEAYLRIFERLSDMPAMPPSDLCRNWCCRVARGAAQNYTHEKLMDKSILRVDVEGVSPPLDKQAAVDPRYQEIDFELTFAEVAKKLTPEAREILNDLVDPSEEVLEFVRDRTRIRSSKFFGPAVLAEFYGRPNYAKARLEWVKKLSCLKQA